MSTFDKYTLHSSDGMSRCMTVFNESMKTDSTRDLYTLALNQFLKFADIRTPDQLITLSQKDLQVMIEDYVFSLKKRLNTKSIETYLTALKLFFSMNDIVLNWIKIRKFLPEKQKTTGSQAYTTKDVREILSIINGKSHLRLKAMVLFLASSGVRVGCLHELQMKDLKDMSHDCKSVLVYRGSKDEYTTFISHEAVKALNEYHEERTSRGDRINEDSFVFATHQLVHNFRGLTRSSVVESLSYFSEQLNRVVESKTDSSIRYTKQANHAFRKRFNTILKSNQSVNISLAERLMGHNQLVKLDNAYFDPTVESLFKEYLKALPDLLIDERYELQNENLKKQQEIDQLQSDKNRIIDLESRMREMQFHIDNITTKQAS